MATWKDVLKNVNSEIGRILHFESEMSKFLIGLAVQFEISDLGFEMQDSSNFKFAHPCVIQICRARSVSPTELSAAERDLPQQEFGNFIVHT